MSVYNTLNRLVKSLNRLPKTTTPIRCFCTTKDTSELVEEERGDRKHKGSRKIIYVRGQKNKFIDWRKVHIAGGNGGDGSCKFMNARSHKGGPYGGDGASGGNVVAVACHNTKQLRHLEPQYKAEKGGSGRNAWKRGKTGKDMVFRVPVGTTILNYETRELLAEFVTDGEVAVLAEGGEGGLGNEHFKAPDHVRPFEFTKGGKGKSLSVEIEMKSIADIGLVGMPNAGKSTLLAALTRAKPKIAEYPFTTLRPNLGVIQYGNGVNLTIADIPGLIEGAHYDKGLGHAFLRHVERCRGLLFVIDSSNTEPLKHLNILQKELELYESSLSSLPAFLVANKIDLLSDDKDGILEEMRSGIGLPVIGISAKFGCNVENLKSLILESFAKRDEAV